MAVNSGIIRASIPVSSRRVISIFVFFIVLAVVLSAESALGFITTHKNTHTQTSFNFYTSSSSAVKSKLPLITPSHTSNIASITTRQRSSMSSTTALSSQSLPTDKTLSSLLDIAIKASKLAGKSAFVLFCCVLWCVQNEDSAIRTLHLNLVAYVIAFTSRITNRSFFTISRLHK